MQRANEPGGQLRSVSQRHFAIVLSLACQVLPIRDAFQSDGVRLLASLEYPLIIIAAVACVAYPDLVTLVISICHDEAIA
jgi:hypothetical protein